MKETLEFVAWLFTLLLLIFLFSGDPDVFDLLLAKTKAALK